MKAQYSIISLFLYFFIGALDAEGLKINNLRKITATLLSAGFLTFPAQAWSISVENLMISANNMKEIIPTTPSIRSDTNNNRNLLMNPLLESYRKFDQLESDEAMASVDNNHALYLVPIVKMQSKIRSMCMSLENSMTIEDINSRHFAITHAKNDLSDDIFIPKIIKKIFNRYADNIFYADPDQANMYLGGGALPSSRQTEQYLIRNDIISKLDDLKADIELSMGDQSLIADSVDDCAVVLKAFDEYMSLSPKDEVALAQEIVQLSRK